MNFQKWFFDVYLQNWQPLKGGGPRRLPSLPNGRTGPALDSSGSSISSSNCIKSVVSLSYRQLYSIITHKFNPTMALVLHAR